MADLQTGLRGSAETWRSNPPAPEVPEELLPPRQRIGQVEASGLAATPPAARSDGRRSSSRPPASPDRGLPVADRREVGAFASRLLRTRRAHDHRVAGVARAGRSGWPGGAAHSRLAG